MPQISYRLALGFAVSLFVALVCADVVEVRAAETAPATVRPVVSSISVFKGKSGALQVAINGDSDLPYEYFVIEGKSLVIDVPGATNGVNPAEQQISDPSVSRVRVAEQGGDKPGVRVAFDLLGPTPFAVQPGSRHILVSFAKPASADSGSMSSSPVTASAAVAPIFAAAAQVAPSAANRDNPSTPSRSEAPPQRKRTNRVTDIKAQLLARSLHVKVSTRTTPAYKVLSKEHSSIVRIAVLDADMADPFPRVTDYTYLNSSIQSVAAWPEPDSVMIAVDFFEEIPAPRIFTTGQSIEMVFDLPEAASLSSAVASPALPSFVEMPPVMPVLPDESRSYSGTPISLVFEDAEITQILSLIGSHAKVNIVTWDGVKGKRSVSLENIPWDQALELLCKTHSPRLVQFRESENVIRVSTYDEFFKQQDLIAKKSADIKRQQARAIEEYTKAVTEKSREIQEEAKAAQERAKAEKERAEAERAAAQARNDVLVAQRSNEELLRQQEAEERMRNARLERRTFRISYGDVSQIGDRILPYSNSSDSSYTQQAQQTVDEAGYAPKESEISRTVYSNQGGKRPVSFQRNDIIFEVNKESKTIFVQDFHDNIALMELIVSALDLAPPAVMVEARIVEVYENADKSLGIQWGANAVADAAHGNATQYAFPNSINIAGGVEQASSGINPGTYMVNLPASNANSGIGLSFGHVANTFSLDVKLSAMESMGKTKILSNPKILVLQNKEAKINVGRKMPVPQTNSEGDTTVEWLDVGIQLRVKPEITNDGKVIMEVEIKKEDVGETVSTTQGMMYSLNSSSAVTRVIVSDGETSVIGGLFTQNKTNRDESVPGLADLPLIGWMFKSKTATDDRSELMIFLTPKLMSPPREAPRETPN